MNCGRLNTIKRPPPTTLILSTTIPIKPTPPDIVVYREGTDPTENNKKKRIPNGIYCYDENGICPYWSLRANKSEQENGHCSFLNEGDWESDHFSLLWDQVKECGENLEGPSKVEHEEMVEESDRLNDEYRELLKEQEEDERAAVRLEVITPSNEELLKICRRSPPPPEYFEGEEEKLW